MIINEIKELIEMRDKHCIVRSKAAQGIGITESALYRLENGNSNKPTPATLLKIRAYIESIKRQMLQEEKSVIEQCAPKLLDFLYNSYEFFAWPKKPGKFQPGL